MNRMGSFGDDVGLVATERIGKKVFIGQYSADVMHKDFIKYVKKRDSVYYFPNEYVIGPVNFCGYVPLFNCAAKD